MSWSQPLTRRIITGVTGEMFWQVNLFLDTMGHVEYADLLVSDGVDTATVPNVITQKTNRIVDALDQLHIDPEYRHAMMEDILTGITSNGINPFVTEKVFGA